MKQLNLHNSPFNPSTNITLVSTVTDFLVQLLQKSCTRIFNKPVQLSSQLHMKHVYMYSHWCRTETSIVHRKVAPIPKLRLAGFSMLHIECAEAHVTTNITTPEWCAEMLFHWSSLVSLPPSPLKHPAIICSLCQSQVTYRPQDLTLHSISWHLLSIPPPPPFCFIARISGGKKAFHKSPYQTIYEKEHHALTFANFIDFQQEAINFHNLLSIFSCWWDFSCTS